MKTRILALVKSYMTPENILRAKLMAAQMMAQIATSYLQKHSQEITSPPIGSAEEFTDHVG